MATVTLSQAYDFNDLFSEFFDSGHTMPTHTAQGWEWDASGAVGHYTGSGLHYQTVGGDLLPDSGKVTGYSQQMGGQTQVTISGLVRIDSSGIAGSVSTNDLIGYVFRGNDHINGSSGADFFWGGNGNDVLHGGDGNDTIGNGSLINLYHGNQQVYGDGGDDSLYGGQDNDKIYGGTGDDWIHGEGGKNIIDGGDGNDAIQASSGNDVITGGNGDDSIGAGDGNNKIDGGAGDDSIVGGGGKDMINGGTGDDTVWSGGGSGTIHGNDGNDEIHALGNVAIFADAGNDTIYGQSGADKIDGGSGNDLIYGQGGNDTLTGGLGDDTIWADDRSVVDGGAGADTFIFNHYSPPSGGSYIKLVSFQTGIDHINLDTGASFSALSTGALSANEFYSGTAAHDSDDRIIYNTRTGALYYDADGNGGGSQVLIAMVGHHAALNYTDISAT